MIDLREHKEAILAGLRDVQAKDANWGWGIKSLGKSKVLIRWGYLEEIDGGSRISIRVIDEDDEEIFIGARMDDRYPVDYLLDEDADDLCVIIGKRIWCDTDDVDAGLRKLVNGIGYISRNRY